MSPGFTCRTYAAGFGTTYLQLVSLVALAVGAEFIEDGTPGGLREVLLPDPPRSEGCHTHVGCWVVDCMEGRKSARLVSRDIVRTLEGHTLHGKAICSHVLFRGHVPQASVVRCGLVVGQAAAGSISVMRAGEMATVKSGVKRVFHSIFGRRHMSFGKPRPSSRIRQREVRRAFVGIAGVAALVGGGLISHPVQRAVQGGVGHERRPVSRGLGPEIGITEVEIVEASVEIDGVAVPRFQTLAFRVKRRKGGMRRSRGGKCCRVRRSVGVNVPSETRGSGVRQRLGKRGHRHGGRYAIGCRAVKRTRDAISHRETAADRTTSEGSGRIGVASALGPEATNGS